MLVGRDEGQQEPFLHTLFRRNFFSDARRDILFHPSGMGPVRVREPR